MKKVKFIVCFFLLLFCIAINGEIYQNYLDTFTLNFNYFDMSLRNSTLADTSEIVKTVAEENEVKVFFMQRNTLSAFTLSLDIFADEDVKEILNEKYEVQHGTYKSIFSGKTEIEFKPVSEAITNDEEQRFYFIGETENVNKIRKALEKDYFLTLVKKESSTANKWVVTGVWVLFCLIMVLLTRLDIQFQKKENFILISLGRDKRKIIIKNIITDTFVLTGMFLIIKLILSRFSYTGYQADLSGMLFTVAICVNALFYLSMMNFDFKQVLYGANLKSSLLSDCYVIKAISMIITVAVLATNLVLISENLGMVKQYERIDILSEYKFVNLKAMNYSLLDDEDGISVLYPDLISCFSERDKIRTAEVSMRFNDTEVLVKTDKETAPVLADIPEVELKDINSDFVIYIHSDSEEKEEKLESTIKHTKGMLKDKYKESITFKIVEYTNDKEVLYFDVDENSGNRNGFSVGENPVILICNISAEVFDYESYLTKPIDNTMFLITEEEIAELESSEAFKALGVEIETMGVVERCNEYRANVMRTLLLSSVISVFMLLLELAIITTIIKLEYTINATESAIKKVIGYSVYKRNKTIFLLNLFAALIGVLTVVVAALMASFAKLMGLSQWYTVVLAGVGLLVLEWPVMLYYINKTEKTSVPKILKGGSL